MVGFSTVTLMGKVGRAPKALGDKGCRLSVEWEEHTPGGKTLKRFIAVKVFGKTSDKILSDIGEGDPVLVTGGRLESDSWEDKKTGEKKYETCVSAYNVQKLVESGSKGGGEWEE